MQENKTKQNKGNTKTDFSLTLVIQIIIMLAIIQHSKIHIALPVRYVSWLGFGPSFWTSKPAYYK